MDWSIISVLIALASLALSFYTYYMHERKLKFQQEAINESIIEKGKKEKEEERKARPVVTYDIDGKNRFIRIENQGKASARNIRFECSDDLTTFPEIGKLFPYPELSPGQIITMRYIPEIIDSVHQTVTLKWDDEYGENRSEERTITLSYY